jgi:hypothetical protein
MTLQYKSVQCKLYISRAEARDKLYSHTARGMYIRPKYEPKVLTFIID